ncbi:MULTISPECIES: HlyD family secretion protein [Vibrio]|uniref:HlyD family secretion protein n=1 Tax=Vibrio casei TaxID=673372 RepID=A0A368LPW0_9VIBR|nr:MULTISPECIES: HlyD family secretion protein [Vibrio]RCS73944.1 HlyD family secretion protein [Vibrio casei]SJN32053.1 Multidrug resistance efflux pump [Vibrio casei]HBV77127.1 HlyD family secretion protein [Vibrio sp.]
METILILTYTAFCIAIFKIFRIPLNKWTVPTAVLGGVVLLGSIFLAMNYFQPFTQLGGQIYSTTPMVSNVRARVVSVEVEPNKLVKQGDVLVRLDDTPFKAIVVQKKAALAATKQNVLVLEAAYKQAAATSVQALAERDRSQREAVRYQKGYKRGAFTLQQVDDKQQTAKGAEAAYQAALSNENAAKAAYESQIDGVNTSVAEAQATLDQAQFNLDQTIVRAPTDGYVSQLALKPGVMAVPLPFKPILTFVSTQDPREFVGAFRQNSTLNIKPGNEADVIFRALPGKSFKAEVTDILPAIAESQIQATGTLLGTSALQTQGRIMVKFRLKDDISQYNLPMGTNVEIAVYSGNLEHVAIIRKILIRMKSWQNYVYFDH